MGLRARLLLAFLVPTVVLFSAGGFLLFRVSRYVLETELGTSLSGIAATISSQVRAERVLALTEDDVQGGGSRTYRSLVAQLTQAKEATGLRRVLIFDTQRRARLDVGGRLPPLAEIPELLRDSLELERVFAGQRAASQVLFETDDGQAYKTGYAPLFQEGEVVGAVAVEGNAEYFASLRRLWRSFLLLAGLTLTLLALAATVSALALKRPLDRLVASALRIGSGDLTTRVTAEGQWEIGILARQLELMRSSLHARDAQLKMMLGGVAHEVKNPLGGIELFSGLLAEELGSTTPDLVEGRSHLARIQRELDYLKRIVDDFLAFAREQRLNPSDFEARALLERAESLLSADARAKEVAITLEAESVHLWADESLLTSAIVNLVKNAVQVSAPRQTVHLSAHLRGDRVLIAVADNGPGIAATHLERIFEPFFTTREKGTGLGLALARKIAEAHQGTLTAQSVPGHTVFELSLPMRRTP